LYSSNGTFINEKKIGKGNKDVLNYGDEISLSVPSASNALGNPALSDSISLFFVNLLH
jgi:hypothetical protein